MFIVIYILYIFNDSMKNVTAAKVKIPFFSRKGKRFLSQVSKRARLCMRTNIIPFRNSYILCREKREIHSYLKRSA